MMEKIGIVITSVGSVKKEHVGTSEITVTFPILIIV